MMQVRAIETDAKTGKTIDRWVESGDTLTEADGIAAERDRMAGEARAERFRRIAACDWTVLPDVPMDSARRSEWAAYRQALRDVTDQIGFPDSIAWPMPPG